MSEAQPAHGTKSGLSLWRLTLFALGIKALTLIVDPNPQFFLGDSGSYLYTALTGWIPLDRSYLYGYLIRWICLGSGSLFPLVLVQTLASSLSAGILGWSLQRFLQAPPFLTIVVMVAYCFDPLQLMYDRFVMAESFSLCAAMIFITFLLVFIDTGKRRFLLFASVAGVIAVALRISYLPAVTALSFAAPLIRLFSSDSERGKDLRLRLKQCGYSIGVITISHFTLHMGYKSLTGTLSGAPPAYQYADGFSLLSSWCPLMNSEDLQAAAVSDTTLAGTYPRTFESRRAQRWMDKGIVLTLTRAYADSGHANAVAKEIAFHILRRDPVGVANLGLRTYLRGYGKDVIKGCIKEDTGDRPIPPELIEIAAKSFHLAAADMPTRHTWTKSYFGWATQWYRALLLTPLLLVITVPFTDRRKGMFVVVVTIFSVIILLTIMGLAVDNSIRYLHPLSWTFFVFLTYWIVFCLDRIKNRTARASRLAALVLGGCCFLGLAPSTAVASPPGLYVSHGTLMRQGKPYVGIGANYFSLFGTLLQNGDNHSSLDNLAALAKAGIPFVRFRACGFGPENFQLYLQNRTEYFRRMDLVVHAAEDNNIGLIPSLFWRLASVPEVVGESRDQLGNPNSKSNQFIRQYTKEMVSRFNDSPAIWGWEFGNEANLGVDLGGGVRRGRNGQLFGQQAGNQLSTQGLRTVFASFAQTIRSIDSSRIIESGTSVPRPAAWHMARGQAGRDSADQAAAVMLTLTPAPMNVVSVHVYEKAKGVYPGARSTADVLTSVTRAAAGAGMPVFLGEFPVRDPGQAQEFLQAIEAARVPLSAFWVFDLPAQEGTMSVSFKNQRAFAIDMVAKANRTMQGQ